MTMYRKLGHGPVELIAPMCLFSSLQSSAAKLGKEAYLSGYPTP